MNKNTTQRGFSLMEMIVAIGIFSLVALVAVAASIKIFGIYGKTQTLNSAIDNLNFALESMSRDIRFGTFVDAGNDFIVVEFEEPDGSTSEIEYSKVGDKIVRLSSTGDDSDLTSDQMEIQDFRVSVAGIGDDNLQPKATILIRGRFTRGSVDSGFSIQTTVTQRNEDDAE